MTQTPFKYPLALSSWGQEELAAIDKIIKEDQYTMGKYVREMEGIFAEYHNVPYCVMVNSGSSANLLAVAALFYTQKNPLKRGDEVIVPAVSWATTYTPLHQYGLKLRFVDIDRETLNLDLNQLEKALTPNTRAIFAVNLLGNSIDYARLNKIIAGKNIILLEDNCESLGAELNGQKAGSFGVMGTCSAFFSHHISTMEGGFVTTRDEELYHILLSLRAHGWTRNLPKENKVTGVKSDNEFDESFKFVLPGYNVRPLEMSGAIGIEQMKKLPAFIVQRRKNAEVFNAHMANHEFLQVQRETGKSSWFGFSLLLKENATVTQKGLAAHLKQKAIDVRPIVTGNFVKNPVIKFFDHDVFNEVKNADYIDQHGLFVGNHHVPMEKEIEWLAKELNNFCK